MYFLSCKNLKDGATIWRATAEKPIKHLFSTHQNKKSAVEAMLNYCSHQDFLYIESVQHHFSDVIRLLDKWGKQSGSE